MTLMSGATLKMSQGAKVQQEATEQTATIVNEMVASNKGVAENAGEMSKAATDASSSASEMAIIDRRGVQEFGRARSGR